jgi:DNA polymerase III epsilon subunit family exonuclease
MSVRDSQTALLDRLYAKMIGNGEPGSLEPLAESLFHSRGGIGARVLGALLEKDPRFHVQGDRVSAIPPKTFSDESSLDSLEFAILDFETNGFAPGERAIEVGITCFTQGREVRTFETLLNPGTAISPFVVRLTGIRPRQLEGMPRFEDIWPDVADMLDGRLLVAHNLPFDRRILRNEVRRAGGDPRVGEEGLCTLKLARRLLPKDESKGLDALADRFGLSFQARHRALDDARVTGKVLFRLLDMAAEHTPLETLGDLRSLLDNGSHLPDPPPARA